jgi:hypothetical protein
MKSRLAFLCTLRGRTSGLAPVLFLVFASIHLGRAGEVPKVTEVTLSGTTLNHAWTGNSTSYLVEKATTLAAPDWRSAALTARTNIALGVTDGSAFFRVAPASTNQSSIVLNVTNTATGDTVTFTNVPQTNADLVFNDPTSSSPQMQMIFPATELQKFDIVFDNQGGFSLVTNAQSFGWGGRIISTPGPGTNQMTFSGFATNYAGSYAVSAVTDPDEGGVLGGLIGSMCWLYCLPGLAGAQLGCAAACTSQATSCALQFKASYCKFVETIDASGILTNNITCNYDCQHGCK